MFAARRTPKGGEAAPARGTPRGPKAPRVAQDPQPRAANRPQAGLQAFRHKLILPIAQKGEVVVHDPGQEGRRLVHLTGHRRRRRLGELGGDRLRARDHRRPVLDRRAHLLEHVLDPAGKGREPLAVGLPVQLDVSDRFGDRVRRVDSGNQRLHEPPRVVAPDADHGVDQEVDPEALPGELDTDRVDEKRHVIADHLDGGMRRSPAVVLEIGVVDANLGGPRGPLLSEVPVRDRGPVKVDRAPADKVLRRDPMVVLANERLTLAGLAVSNPFVDARADRLDQLGLEIRRLHCHVRTFLVLRLAPAI